jgi:hypothetical protein
MRVAMASIGKEKTRRTSSATAMSRKRLVIETVQLLAEGESALDSREGFAPDGLSGARPQGTGERMSS